ncbi:MAG: SDR family oxidoreductase [Anaerolineae bacterium]|nr:SDR family oxidoreductase [Anaerolineae bacterium]MDW8172719.1 SDR family oxidoreductase [Anaerolineae bacterium]
MGRLQDKVAIVTGAARGIGAAIALRYASEGCSLALCDLNLEGAEGIAEQVRTQYGVQALAVRTDVARRDEVETLVAATLQRFGTLDILVNNAAMFYNAPFEQQSDEQWDTIMDVNVKSVFMMSQAVIRHWLATARGGAIINLASISASVAFVNSSAYCTTKAAVASLTRCLALEYGPKGIRANSIAPGIIDTPMLPSQEDNERWVREKLPIPRLGTPADVADLALFLASDESRYITGDMIYIDGGWMLN